MDNEQLVKKVEWLEAGRRESDKRIALQEKQLGKLEALLNAQQEIIKAYKKDIAKALTGSEKVKDLAAQIKEGKSASKKEFQAHQKAVKLSHSDLENNFLEGQRKLERDILSVREELGQISALQKRVKSYAEGESRLKERMSTIEEGLDKVIAAEMDRSALAQSLKENRIEDDKRIVEMEGLVQAISDQSKDTADKQIRVNLAQDKLERDLDDLEGLNKAREKEQRAFIQRGTNDQIEKDRIWAEWEKRFSKVEKQSEDIALRLMEIETLDIAVKRAQDTFNQLAEKINRRVNEITEIQRLGEQRFRKEWSTFQTDWKKRHASEILNQEELQRESTRKREKILMQINLQENKLRDIEEMLQHVSDQSENLMQSLLESARDALTKNEQFLDSIR